MTGPLFEALKRHSSPRLRRRIVRGRLAARQVSAEHRALPDFLIIGAQRCGTSSLYKYLGAHPQIVPSLRKETGYFSEGYEQGLKWYRAHFPLQGALKSLQWARGVGLTFEATPDYLFDPRSPRRVKDTMPGTLFIVLLRDPVERAYSHWRHMRRLGFESLPFEEAVAAEPERISAQLQAMHEGQPAPGRDVLRFSYLARGYYAAQLPRWFTVFPKDQFLILTADEFYNSPEDVVSRVCRFVGVDDWTPREFRNYSQQSSTGAFPEQGVPIPSDVADSLRDQFSVENRGLSEMAGLSIPWE